MVPANPAAAPRDEARILDEIAARVPKHQRARLRAFLEKGGPGVGSHRPEIAALVAELAALRWNALALADEGQAAARAAAEAELENMVRVAVCLVATMKTGVRATVLRRPNDRGRPTVLLRDDATSSDFELGLQMAVRAFERVGVAPDKVHRLEYRGRPGRPLSRNGATADRFLADLRRVDLAPVAGVGPARMLYVARKDVHEGFKRPCRVAHADGRAAQVGRSA